MITFGEIAKLHSTCAPDETVLSVYTYVPQDPAGSGDVLVRACGLIAAATMVTPGALRPGAEHLVRRIVTERVRECAGHTLCIFVSEQLGLLEAIALPGWVAERAVLAVRPHVRPLLAALQRHPDYRIVIIDHRHAWLLSVAADRIEVVATISDADAPTSGFGGWYLQPSTGLERLTEHTGHLYQDAAAILDRQAKALGARPVVIGGYADMTTTLLALLPQAVLASYAGGFAVDPHELTLARARELATPLIAGWVERRERQLVQAVTDPAPRFRAAVGLDDCLIAVNASEIDVLLLADQPTVPGFYCERCDALLTSSDGCCDWGAAARAIPDLLEEMAWRTLHDGGQVVSARALPCQAAARLR